MALCATAASQSSFSYATWIAGRECQKVMNGSDLPSVWENIEFSDVENPHDPRIFAAVPFYRQGIRIFISDLLWIGDPRVFLTHFIQGAAAAIIIQVLAPIDASPDPGGNMRLIDSESGETKELLLDDTVLKSYLATLAQHQQNWHRACRGAGAFLTTVRADEIVVSWDLPDLLVWEIMSVE
jgi:hypothetical protein